MPGCRPFTDAEVPRLLRAVVGPFVLRDRAFLVVGLYTGFRASELLSLRVRDVVADGRFLDAIEVKRRHLKGGSGAHKRQVESRSVPMHAKVKRALTPWLREMRSRGWMRRDDYLFQSRASGNVAMSIQSAWRLVKCAAAGAGLTGHIGTHSMRKTFAARAQEMLRGDVFKLQKLLGHTDPKTTTNYMSFDRKELDAVVLKMR